MFSLEVLRLEKAEALVELAYHSRHGHRKEIDAYSGYIGFLFNELKKAGEEIKEIAEYAKT